MQKVFLLLRNNQQSGPYDLDELLQLQLKPFDLVWVTGRSAAWQYPGEIPMLQPYMPITPQTDVPFQPITTAAMERQQAQAKNFTEAEPVQKKVFVSMPRTITRQAPIENPKVVEPKSEISFPEETWQNDTREKFNDTRAKSYSEPLHEEPPLKTWNYQPVTKKKSIRSKDVMATLILGGLIAGGYFLLSKPSLVPGGKLSSTTVVANTPAAVIEEKKPVIEEKKPEVVVSNNLPVDHDPVALPAVKQKQKINQNTKHSDATLQTVTKKREENPVEEIAVETNNNNSTVLKTESNTPQGSAQAKKKKIGQAIKNIFNPKKKTEEPKNTSVVLEEPKPATDRKAARREDPPASSNTTQVPDKTTTSQSQNKPVTNDVEEPSANLADFIDITSNAPENWMMGISGLKITLRNRSNVVIQTAAVNVLYYDENNKLLDRKMVYFSHIPARGKLTQPAPDHKFADHVEFKLSAVSAKEDRYAKD